MAETKRETWLVAAWPGMGNVGVGAGAYLVTKLGARMVHELPTRDVFELVNIEVKEGLAKPGRLPRSMFFEWHNPKSQRDLLLFVGEAQPPVRGYSFCHKLLDYAQSRGITRIITFAAMATQLHPTETPRVFGVATNGQGIRELQALKVTILKEGQITGLNGVLLAAGAERNIPGMCLLGELPFFAAGVPNPKASMAVLETFSAMADVELDMDDLKEQADAVEKGLMQLLEKMQESARQQAEASGEEGFAVPGEEEEEGNGTKGPESGKAKRKEPVLDQATAQRIESMFQAANHDRAKAFQLKQELDRLGVFKQYEDRFLDLFTKGE